jgi:hypothetical protein
VFSLNQRSRTTLALLRLLQVDFELVLRRPIETATLCGHQKQEIQGAQNQSLAARVEVGFLGNLGPMEGDCTLPQLPRTGLLDRFAELAAKCRGSAPGAEGRLFLLSERFVFEMADAAAVFGNDVAVSAELVLVGR